MESLRVLINKNKKIVFGFAAVLVLYSIWNNFLRNPDESAFSNEATSSIASSEIGREIVATLARLNTVDIDTGVLSNDVFQQLRDFSEPLPANVPVSKANPFIEESVSSNPLTTQDTNPALQNTDDRPGSENDAPADNADAAALDSLQTQ